MSQEHEQSRPHDRYFDSNPAQKEIALHLYAQVANLPLICPHGHVDPILFSQPDYQFPSPTRLLITPDHYVFSDALLTRGSIGEFGHSKIRWFSGRGG